jgi:hypothetical protein
VRRAAARAGLAAAVLASTWALLPVAASAASFSPSVGFHLEHGRYEVNVDNLGETVVLSVETGALKSQRHVTATSYVVHGTATESRLEASFGELGTLSMRFHPSRHRTWEKPHRNCRGLGRFLVRHGTWRGRLRFRGEDDYLHLDLHRARGMVETIAPKCRHGGSGSGDGRDRADRRRDRHHRGRARNRAAAVADSKPVIRPTQEPALGPEVPVLQARWRHGVAAAEFVGGAGKEGSTFYASTEEARGRLAIFRTARAEARPKAVRADNTLIAATLSPPLPFHGSGRYGAAPDGTRTWDGPLFVSFPGAPHYQLTGEPFKATLQLFPELLVGLIGLLSCEQTPPRQLPEPTPGLEPGTPSLRMAC